jgi:REP element-mobilizing transposase RayT
MIHGYHIVLPMYGFWLPNDPRGSWSDFVRKWEMSCFGRSSASLERKSMTELSAAELSERKRATDTLLYPPVSLTGQQALCVGNGFRKQASKSKYTIWACAILPEHTHLVVARHVYKVEQIANLLKGSATREIVADGHHPFESHRLECGKLPSMWASKRWKVYLDSELAIEEAIAYVEQNPEKEGLPRQGWSFVKPFRGIPKGGWTTYQ